MKVGTICYATDQGLGVLAKGFVDHGVVTDVLVMRHPHHVNHWEWYPSAGLVGPPVRAKGMAHDHVEAMKTFCRSMDVMLFFETPYHWPLFDYCRRAGVKTFLMTMYECTPDPVPCPPDVYVCPSALDMRYFPPGDSVQAEVPVDVKWRRRKRAEVFVHNAGRGGLRGRNGTAELLDAMMLVKSPVKLILRSQVPLTHRFLGPSPGCGNGPVSVDYRPGTVPHDQLWDEGDVFVFPEKFNGLSLPIREACAAGMLVMATGRFPNTDYLPRVTPLIPVSSYVKARIGPGYKEFEEAVIDPKHLAEHIDDWYGYDVTAASEAGREWAELHSWDRLGPWYKNLLGGSS